MVRYDSQTKPGLVALYDILPGNGAGLFLQPRSLYGQCTTKQCKVSNREVQCKIINAFRSWIIRVLCAENDEYWLYPFTSLYKLLCTFTGLDHEGCCLGPGMECPLSSNGFGLNKMYA